MWRDIAASNRDALLADIASYQLQLTHLAELIRNVDTQQLEQIFDSARDARNAWLRQDA